MMKNSIPVLLICVALIGSLGCNGPEPPLPVIGDRITPEGDTVVHHIRPFEFVNQMGDTVTNATYANRIYMTDFFFTSCPTICPKVKKQMLRIYDQVKDNEDIVLVSHSIDPKRDSVSVLKIYAENLGIDHAKWHFLTGDKEELLDIADDYFVAAYEDPSVPGGFDHSGKIILLDRSGRIRGFCDGTDPESVTRFLKDIKRLEAEYEP